jgi:hypothetical protein
MQDFPSLIKHDGIIRLKVAAICTSLDTMISRNEEVQEEIAPFYEIVEKKFFDLDTKIEHKTSSPIEPHAFLYMTPTGSLGELVATVLFALKKSIANGELETVALKVDLVTDEIDEENTWIGLNEFSKWCISRNLELDDFCSRYDDAEDNILCRIDDWVYDERRAFESPFFDARYVDRHALHMRRWEERTYDAVLRENILLRMGFDPSSADTQNSSQDGQDAIDKPLRTTERNALLSIIAVLCDENGYNTARAAKTAAIIKNRADLAGIDLGETTIENHLKKIPDAITRRLRREPK